MEDPAAAAHQQRWPLVGKSGSPPLERLRVSASPLANQQHVADHVRLSSIQPLIVDQ